MTHRDPGQPGTAGARAGASRLRTTSQREAPVAFFRKGSGTPEGPTDPPQRTGVPGQRKSGPTPTRKEAEAARRQRVTQTMTKREIRAAASRHNRAERMRVLSARDATPEKALLRDYIDARFSIGEVLLPSLVVILALSFLNAVVPEAAVIGTVVMYLYILAVLADLFVMWRGFKRVLAERLPDVSPKGLLMYGANRAIQIRRFRIPAPRIQRGEAY